MPLPQTYHSVLLNAAHKGPLSAYCPIRPPDTGVAAQVLAEQIVQNPAMPRWLFKIDDEHLGRGHAYMDVAAVPGIAAA